jgi:hypothetical protein
MHYWLDSSDIWSFWDGSSTLWGRTVNLTNCQTWFQMRYVRVHANVSGKYYIKITDNAPGTFWVVESNCVIQGTESDHYQISAGGYRDFRVAWVPAISSASGTLSIQLKKETLFTDPVLDTVNISHVSDGSSPNAPIVNSASSESCIGLTMEATDRNGSTASGVYGFEVHKDGILQTGDGHSGYYTANNSGYRYVEFCGFAACSNHSFIVSAIDNVKNESSAVGRNASTLCPPTLTSLSVSGPTSVNENSGAQYTATAYWSDGSSTNVTSPASWSENSSYASISSSGYLSTSSVSSNQSVTITASYSSGGVTRSDTHSVTIVNEAPTLTSLSVSGPTSVNENSGAQYAATAYWSDGSSTNVTSPASWSENSSYASISSSGYLSTSSVSSNQSVTITASYSSGGVTRSDTHSVTIVNQAATLTSLSVSGPTSVNENSGAQYTATAYWSDGSNTNVTSSASWSENSSYASISNSGYLSTSSVSSNQSVTITASYSSGGVTRSDTHSVTIVNQAATLTSLSVSGPTSVNENSGAQYTATAYWSDGSNTNVASSASWSENSSYASISNSGYLSTSSVSSNQSVTITASYSSGGVTRSDTHSVTIVDGTVSCTTLFGSCGSTVNGSIDSSDCDTSPRGAGYFAEMIDFVGNAGETFTITASWQSFDGFLYLERPSGSVAVFNDDFNGTAQSQIADFVLDESGHWVIWTTTYSAGTGGAYTVDIESDDCCVYWDGYNYAPEAQLHEPTDGAVNVPLLPSFSWQCTQQWDGAPVYYRVRVSAPGGIQPYATLCETTNTSCVASSPLVPGATYLVHVWAYSNQFYTQDISDTAYHSFTTTGGLGHIFSDGFDGGNTSAWSVAAVVGEWTLHYDWDCDGDPGLTTITFVGDGTFQNSDGATVGTWVQSGTHVSFVYYGATASYDGTIAGNSMSGTMSSAGGMTGCWTAVR